MLSPAGKYNMDKLLLTLVVLMTLKALSQGQMDTAFCDKHRPTQATTCVGPPDLPKDYATLVESFHAGLDSNVETDEEVLSTRAQKLYYQQSLSTGSTSMYVLTQSDQFLSIQNKGSSGGQCVSQPLGGSVGADAFQIKRINNVLTIPEPKTMVVSSSPQYPQYVGTDTIRGIPAKYWYECTYRDWDNTTRANYLYYSHDSYSMPGMPGPVPLLTKVSIKDGKSGITFDERNDFMHFKQEVDVDDPVFEIRPTLWCADRPEASNLPSMPDIFQFKIEEVNLGDTQSLDSTVHPVNYFKETYLSPLDRYLVESEMASKVSKDISILRDKEVHDYRTGLDYFIEVPTATCNVSNITGIDGTISPTTGKVQLKSAQSLLDLTGHGFQYMGEHKDWDRGIDADVFTSMADNNGNVQMVTWYFASKNWMENVLRVKASQMYPLPLRVKTSSFGASGIQDTKVADLYEYTRNPGDSAIYPDLSACFNPAQEIYVDLLVDARYDLLYLSDARNFLDTFRATMISNTDLLNMLRIADLRVEPTTEYKTLVRFTLLNTQGHMTGDVSYTITEPASGDIYREMESQVKAGTFVISVENSLGKYDAKAIGIRKRDVNPKSFAGSQADNAPSSGISSGAMAGMGVGMILLGLILGFAVIKLFRKFRNDTPDISMQHLK